MKKPYLSRLFGLYIVFAIALLWSAPATAQGIDFGKSYINVTKGNNGGTIEPGDILEIRAAIVVRSGTYDSIAFYDTIQAGVQYIPGTVRILTNEGKIYKQFTDSPNDDEGWIIGNYVRINVGYKQSDNPANRFRRGRVAYNHRPSVFGSSCIMIASYRVLVTANFEGQIRTGGGAFTYKISTAGKNTPVSKFVFPNNVVAIYPNYGMCSNSVGTNALGTEFNGTFGQGKSRNRGPSANVPTGYTYDRFGANSPQDYYYGVANNTSINTGYTTSNAWPKPDNSRRVFGLWDIIGDHTGAADPYEGNPAADTVANPNAGYMLIINAAYRIDSAFQQTISNLCPNTYYEISVWIRNICSRCGCDSTGKGAGTAGYIPTAPGDSSGVYPNITFEIDGLDYYTTGNILYTGKWIKKGFVFRTGPAQTSFTLKLFNNAPGGGGNDWALDDISVSTCSPNLTFTPENNPMYCSNNVVSLGSRVQSFFNNYTEYKWQHSVDGGLSWQATPVTGSAEPVQVNGAWEYHIEYPSFVGTLADSGHKYRMVVATTKSNLNNENCSFYGNTSVLTLNIEKCIVLDNRFLRFAATISDGRARLRWAVSQEQEPDYFLIERSTDGHNFIPAAHIYPNGRFELSWEEQRPLQTVYYRVKMILPFGKTVISDIISVKPPGAPFSILAPNPFSSTLRATLHLPQAGRVQLQLTDGSGRAVWRQAGHFAAGSQLLSIPTHDLPDGVYILSGSYEGGTVHHKLIKNSRL